MKLVHRYDSPEPEPAGTGSAEPGHTATSPGSRNHPVPRPEWISVVDGKGNQNQNQPAPASPPEPGISPEPGTRTTGSEDIAGVVLKSGARLVLVLGGRFWRAFTGAALRHAETPGHPFHAVWHYQPGTLAGHHVHAKSHERGADEFQMHTLGRALAFTGIGLIALGHSVRGQRIAALLLALAAVAIVFLVF